MLDVPESDVVTLLTDVRRGLDSDGYDLELVGVTDVIELAVKARPDVCEECLVGKDVMRGVIADAIADMYDQVGEDQIVLHYPADVVGDGR